MGFFVSFYFFLITKEIRGSIFHTLWSYMFFCWSLGILSEIKFKVIFSLTDFLQEFQQSTAIIIKFLIAQLQFFSISTFFFNDKLIFFSFPLFLVILFYFIKNFKNLTDVYKLKHIKYFNLLSLIGSLYIFLEFNYTGSIFMFIGMVITYLSVDIYNSKIKFLEGFNHRELYNCMQGLAIIFFYRGGVEIPPF